MDLIRSQFLAGVSLNRIDLQQTLENHQDWDKQLHFLNQTLLDPIVLKCPPKLTYQIAFLKQIIASLELIATEIRDEFYEHLVSLQDQQKIPQEWTFKHYTLPTTSTVVSIKEAPQIISSGTTGLSCWEAGIFLADWICQNREVLQGKRVLELGSGTGVTGLIAASSCEPRELILSDCHDHVLALLRENVKLNDCQDSTQVLDLNWDSPNEVTFDPEIILAADVVYDDTIFRPLVNLLLTFVARNRSLQIYLAATVRNEETLGRFLKMVEESGLNVEEVCSSSKIRITLHWDDKTEIKLFFIRGGGC